MILMAFRMLIGNQASCIGVIFGVFLATLLISQQSAIFLGLLDRSYRIVTDISEPTIWVMDPATESEDKFRSMPLNYLDLVRGVHGVDWAVPLNSAVLPSVTASGKFNVCLLYGVDDATLIGAPSQMVAGSVRDLRRDGGIIVDEYSAKDILAHVENGVKKPLQLGDTLEISGQRALVVGISKMTPGFYPQPIIFTSFSQFKTFDPRAANRASFILVKSRNGADIRQVTEEINAYPQLNALSKEEFKNKIRDFFLKTGILINFGLSVLLGVIIGFSIAGQIFYVMTLENLVYYALIKAVGGTNRMVLKMIVFQAALAGFIGFTLGIGATLLWGYAIEGTTLAFLFPWQLLLFSGSIVIMICIFTAILSAQKVLRADPKMLMGT